MTKPRAPHQKRAGLRVTEAGLKALLRYETEERYEDQAYRLTPAGEAYLEQAEQKSA